MLKYFDGYGPKDLKKLMNDTLSFRDRAYLLMGTFNWACTPQKYTFWRNEHDNLANDNELSHEALMYLTVEYSKENEDGQDH